MPGPDSIEGETVLPRFAREMRFGKSWRAYQARVLEKLPNFLKDRHFHLVAAPGSGKTVIGWEVVRRIGKPALILTPTLAIREQWIDRLRKDFLERRSPEWISRNLDSPSEITIGTYQSLSTIFKEGARTEAFLNTLKKRGVSVLVVDEAHHLRATWWKCLSILKDELADPIVIALTATPPIDVPQAEWNRYSSFCGPVDMEVGVPELVAEGNLCPHQDYVLFSVPEGREVDQLERFHSEVSRLVLDLQLDLELAESLGRHSRIEWIRPGDGKDYLRQHQKPLLAVAMFLQQSAGFLPPDIAEAFQLETNDLPSKLTVAWAETLLNGLLFDFRDRISQATGVSPETETRLDGLKNRLSTAGALEKGRVVLRDNEANKKLLRDSPAKLHSIAEIIDHELNAQGTRLRAVILADYIRKEAFPSNEGIDSPLVKLGVVPIFELLRRLKLPFLLPGILSGSVIIIPKTARVAFEKIASSCGIEAENLVLSPLFHDEEFLEISIQDSDRQRSVVAITELFQKGEINCLIGTASLLGEGWDAPCINTLVLASVIGSFVMSNQMRGRAIRSHIHQDGKTANIWHIATVFPFIQTADGKKYDAGPDFRKLERRFTAFHGVSFELDESGSARVESGWERLGINSQINSHEVDRINARMFREAEDRMSMEKIWDRAIAPAVQGRFLRPIRKLSAPRTIASTRFIARISGSGDKGLRYGIAGWLERKRLRGIAMAIFRSLQDTDHIDRSRSTRRIRVTSIGDRHLIDAPELEQHDQVIFISALGEFFDVFSNPRYLIQQKTSWAAVPSLLGAKKEAAINFSRNLRKLGFGRHKLHYVHSRQGKDILLLARKKSLLRKEPLLTNAQVHWEPSD